MRLARYWKRGMGLLMERRSTEAYIVAYPKSGSTWLRYLLGRYAQMLSGIPQTPLFDSVDWLGRTVPAKGFPSMRITHGAATCPGYAMRELAYDNTVRPYVGRRSVLLARHPLDCLVSHWHQYRNQIYEECFLGIEAFLQHPTWGLDRCIAFLRLWRGNAGLVVRYEDMWEDPNFEVRRILEYLGVTLVESLLAKAVLDANFSAMQALERSGLHPRYETSGLPIFGPRPGSHVRRGQPGGYHDEIPNPGRYKTKVRQNLAWLGYD